MKSVVPDLKVFLQSVFQNDDLMDKELGNRSGSSSFRKTF